MHTHCPCDSRGWWGSRVATTGASNNKQAAPHPTAAADGAGDWPWPSLSACSHALPAVRSKHHQLPVVPAVLPTVLVVQFDQGVLKLTVGGVNHSCELRVTG